MSDVQDNTKVMILMRTDLNMRKGKMIAQAAHGIHYMILDQLVGTTDLSDEVKGHRHRDEFKEWNAGEHTKITVGVDSLAQLNTICRKAGDAGIPAYIVEDLGKTDVPALTVTCAILGPAKKEELDKFTGKLTNI